MNEAGKQIMAFSGWHFDGDMQEQLKHSRIIGDTSGEFVEYLIERCQRAEGLANSQALEIDRLIQELEKLDERLLSKQDRIDELTRELAEEKTACQIAGQAMDAMRARIERQDEEIRLLRICKRADALHIAAVIAGTAEAVQNFTKQRMDAHSELDEFEKANPK